MSDAHDPHGGAPRPPDERKHGDARPPPDSSAYDLVRESALRALSHEEREQLDAELALDEQLREFAELYPLAHAATEAGARDGEAQLSASTTHTEAWQRLQRELEPSRSFDLGRKAAAALLVGLTCAAAWLGWRALESDRAAQDVTLNAIDAQSANAADANALEHVLATPPVDLSFVTSYSPVRDRQIQWIASLDEGLAVARAAERPLLLFGMYTTCPWCIEMQAEGLRDATVLALAEEFVPVRIVYDDLAPEVVQGFHDRGYPLFELWSPAGEIVHSFPGFFDAPSFVEHLDHASTADRRRSAPPWERVRNVAQQYEHARQAEVGGQFGAAYASYQAIGREPATAAIGELARAGLERIGARAAADLREARLANSDAAADLVARAEANFASTPFAADFARVRNALESNERFPTLLAPSQR